MKNLKDTREMHVVFMHGLLENNILIKRYVPCEGTNSFKG